MSVRMSKMADKAYQRVSIIPGMGHNRKRKKSRAQENVSHALHLGLSAPLAANSDAVSVASFRSAVVSERRFAEEESDADDDRLTDSSDSESDDKKQKRRGAWIAENFSMKDCTKCFCGRTKKQHRKDAQKATEPNDDDDDEPPSLKGLIKEFPTEAYGETQFGQAEGVNNNAKYVRISDNTDSSLIMELLTYYWNLPRPRLVLSITGGGRSFKLNKQDQDTFSRGILKAAQTTDAWILTTGFNAGVPNIVGQTMKENQTLKWLSQGADAEDQGLNCIGIAPWGYVSGSDQLVGTNDKGCYPARYKLSNVIVKNRPVPLNPNHTHFLFVDNGLRNEPAYGGEIKMRAEIEGAIQAPTAVNGLGLPVVLLVLEGGADTILNIRSSIAQGILTVLCDGTGRAADVLAYAHYHTIECADGTKRVKDASIPFLEEKLRIFFGFEPGTEVMNKMIQNINFCVKNEQLITVFEMDEGENNDLDLAIITALLKGQATTKFYQLALALSWNRVDVAHEYICTDEVNWQPGSLDNFVTQAIAANQVGFVELFLEQGIVMKDYLTVSKLRGFYNTCDVDQHFRSLLVQYRGGRMTDEIYLNDVRIVIANLLGNLEDNLYAYDRRHKPTIAFVVMAGTNITGVNAIQKSFQEHLRSERKKTSREESNPSLNMGMLANPGMHFARPFTELFLWALLTDRIKLAEYFWQQTENPILCAIMGSCLLGKMAHITSEPHEQEEYMENANKFEELATGLLDKCYATDNTLAQMMLDVPNDYIGTKTVLSMAAEAEAKVTIHSASMLSNITDKHLEKWDSFWQLEVLFSILFPIFILTNLKLYPADDGSELRPLSKIQVFFTAPVTRFWLGRIAYFATVFLYSYVILGNFYGGITVAEQLLTVCIIILIIEEIRQVLMPGGLEDATIRQRITNWAKSEWNILDALFMIFSLLGIILHYSDKPWVIKWSLGFYGFGCFLLFTMALHVSAISPYLGPLLVMIKKMIKEMFGFLFILFVFLLGYGVAGTALSHPNSDISLESFASIIYHPYFTIYGQGCPQYHPLLPFMLALYLLLGNVLLLNLLIAIFSSVFDEVQEHSVEIWKFEMYTLVMDSSELTILPPPFIIFEHFYFLCRWLIRKCQRKCCKRKQKVKPKYSKRQKRMLKLFEQECAAEFRKEKAEQERDEIPERIKRLDKRLETLQNQHEIMSMDVTKQLQNINKQLSAGLNVTPDLLMSPRLGQTAPLPMTQQGQVSQGQTSQRMQLLKAMSVQSDQSAPEKYVMQMYGRRTPSLDKVKDFDTLSQTSIMSSSSSGSQGRKKKRRSKARTAKVSPESPSLVQESGKWANTQPGAPVQISAALKNTSAFQQTPSVNGQSQIPVDSNHGNVGDQGDVPQQRRGSLNNGGKKLSISADQFMHMNALMQMEESVADTLPDPSCSPDKTVNSPKSGSTTDQKTEILIHKQSVSSDSMVSSSDVALNSSCNSEQLKQILFDHEKSPRGKDATNFKPGTPEVVKVAQNSKRRFTITSNHGGLRRDSTLPDIHDDPEGEELVNLPDIAPKNVEKAEEKVPNSAPKTPDSSTDLATIIKMSSSSSDSGDSETRQDPGTEVTKKAPELFGTSKDTVDSSPKGAAIAPDVANSGNTCNVANSERIGQANAVDDAVFVRSRRKNRRRPKRLQMTVNEYLDGFIVEM